MTMPSIDDIAKAISIPADYWVNRCHEISYEIVRSGILAEPGPETCRVVRGAAPGYGIFGQHSWIALGRPFDPKTTIIDATAHAWGKVEGLVVSTVADAYLGFELATFGHAAHGYLPGQIMNYGRPRVHDLDTAYLLDTSEMSAQARSFLHLLGPLNDEGWLALVTYPHGGWPAREVCEAIVEQVPRAEVVLPIDVVGHTTDLNPCGLYW